MSKIILKYILTNFFKYFFVVILVIYAFGIILNLFEEIEFFKNIDVSVFLTLKINGFSSIKIFFIFASTAFFLGWIILMLINPITSTMLKFYEQTKSKYARDIDHLVSFNKNGLWIKENFKDGERIITASELDGKKLKNVKIFKFDNNYLLKEKILSETVYIEKFDWNLNNVTIFIPNNSIFEKKKVENYIIKSNYNYDTIVNLFNNTNTLSFIDLIFGYENLIKKGYNKSFLNQSLHSMLVFPFFLFLMTGIASILTMHTLKNSKNIKFIIVGIITCVLVYYLKDLSLALGKTGRVPIILSIWSPIIALSLFTFIGILQINEK